MRPRHGRRDGQVPPPRRRGHLRRPRPHGPGPLAAPPAGAGPPPISAHPTTAPRPPATPSAGWPRWRLASTRGWHYCCPGSGCGLSTESWPGGWRSVLLVPEVGGHRAHPPHRLPARRPRASSNVPAERAGDPGQQPPVVRRLAVHAADAAAPGDLRGQGGVLHHPGHQGLVPEEVLLRRRPGADRPVRGQRRRGRADVGQADPRRGRALRHLPRGHPLATTASSTAARPASPGSRSRRKVPGRSRWPSSAPTSSRRPGKIFGTVHPPGRPVRHAAGLLPLRGPGERPLHPALDHRRDHVRDHAALRPGVRRHVSRWPAGANSIVTPATRLDRLVIAERLQMRQRAQRVALAVERQRRAMLRVAVLVRLARILFLDSPGVGQHEPAEVLACRPCRTRGP